MILDWIRHFNFSSKTTLQTLEKGKNSFKKATTATTTIATEVLNWSLETCSLSSTNKLKVNFVVITNESDSDWGAINGKKPYYRILVCIKQWQGCKLIRIWYADNTAAIAYIHNMRYNFKFMQYFSKWNMDLLCRHECMDARSSCSRGRKH